IAASRTPLTVSALGRGGGSAQEFNAGVRADLEDIARFHEELAGRATVDVYETKLFASLFEPGHAKQLFALLRGTAFQIESHGPEALTPFFEPLTARREVVHAALEALVADRSAPEAARRRRCRPAGLKPTCGGLDP